VVFKTIAFARGLTGLQPKVVLRRRAPVQVIARCPLSASRPSRRAGQAPPDKALSLSAANERRRSRHFRRSAATLFSGRSAVLCESALRHAALRKTDGSGLLGPMLRRDQATASAAETARVNRRLRAERVDAAARKARRDAAWLVSSPS